MEKGRCVICWDKKGNKRDCGCTALYCQDCRDKLYECGVCRREFPAIIPIDLKCFYEIRDLKGF